MSHSWNLDARMIGMIKDLKICEIIRAVESHNQTARSIIFCDEILDRTSVLYSLSHYRDFMTIYAPTAFAVDPPQADVKLKIWDWIFNHVFSLS